ncbi:uncharacterized protein LOC126894363 isoform X1 [Daktulosphaira vitifoliae]|uniref:uncharacterized protein LOC126894363 isoform X1 n=1 Tax=Daktulosphaira vitifoliae TaxID=58002 RepID=UPI0021AA57B8|nr:uncharacterized protein LOC126894363 isoform X1 [Daktulosphaira vitifoliae]
MLLTKWILIIRFIQTINQSICVDLNNITVEDIDTLESEYEDMKCVKLIEHPYYIKSRNEENFCPVPWSHAVDCEEVPYEGIEIVNKSLTDVVQRCRSKKKFKLAYTIYLNAIESIVFTFMYRFCEFAIEMNKRCAEISFYLKLFSEKLTELIPIINREWISPKPHECILDVYKKYEKKNNKYKFKRENENYRNDLLGCMNLMKDKVHFLREPKNETINEMTISNLVCYNNMNYDNIVEYLTLEEYSPTLKDITGDKNQTSCIICKTEHSGNIWVIYFFSPCGHGWCCNECVGKIEACPVCNELITSTQKLDIRTSVSIVKKVYESLPPRCILDGREARCIKCRSQIKDDVHHSNRHIMIPCGHGWYCENCIEDKKCLICKHKKTDKLCITLNNNKLHSE